MGSRIRNRLPDIENQRILDEAVRRARREIAGATIQLSQIEGGSVSSGGGIALASYTPITIADGQTFTVPENCQVLYAVPIEVDGDLIIEGELVEVD